MKKFEKELTGKNAHHNFDSLNIRFQLKIKKVPSVGFYAAATDIIFLVPGRLSFMQ